MMSLFDFDNTVDALVKKANEAYDQGEPILEDSEFDLLAETGIEIETRNFRKKVEHPFPMGSLSKIRTGEEVVRWINPAGHLVVMPKLDGCSVRAKYVGGALVEVATRGDGHTGNDITANASKCNIPVTLAAPVDVEIRYEAILPKKYEAQFEKNLRNVAAGMLGAKDPRPELALIDFVAIDIVTEEPLSVYGKRELLDSLLDERHLVDQTMITVTTPPLDLWSWFEKTYEKWRQTLPYKIDGIVVEKFDDGFAPVPQEKELLPKNKVALKFATEAKETTIVDIVWTLGQHQKLTPVLKIDTVEIDGTNVSNVSASNYALLKAAGLGLGARIKVIKSGEIIPKVAEVLEPSDIGLSMPVCPACKELATLSESGVDALCANPDCEGGDLVRLKKTIELFGIEFISDNTVEALASAGFNTLEKIFSLSEQDIADLPGFGLKSASYLVNALKSAELTEAKVIKSAFLKGIGERKAKVLLDHYGSLVDMISSVMVDGLAPIEGFGEVQTNLINQGIGEIADQLHRFKSLGVRIIPHEAPTEGGQVVCCTGTCPLFPRKTLKKVLEDKGFTVVDSVTKNTTLLLCDDPDGSSSKLKKARKAGIPIKSYSDFFAADN